jgi:hypothetical protein
MGRDAPAAGRRSPVVGFHERLVRGESGRSQRKQKSARGNFTKFQGNVLVAGF